MSELDWQNRLGPDFSQNLFKFYIDVVPKTTFLFSLISSICIRFLRSLIYDLLWLHPWSLWYLKISLKVFVIPPKIFYLLAWDSKHWEKNYPRNKSTVYGIFNHCIMTWYCEGDQAFPQKSDLTRRKFSLIFTKPLTTFHLILHIPLQKYGAWKSMRNLLDQPDLVIMRLGKCNICLPWILALFWTLYSLKNQSMEFSKN